MTKRWLAPSLLLMFLLPGLVAQPAAGQGTTAELRVTDPRGRPIPGAAVWVSGSEAETPIAESGPDGRATLRGLDPQAPMDVSICRPGFLSTNAVMKGSSPEAIRVVLEPAARITGRVVDTAGAPIAGAEVHASLDVDRGGCGLVYEGRCPLGDAATGTTDARGRFALDTLLPGTFHLQVLAAGHSGVRLKAEAPSTGPELTIEMLSGAVLSGRVTDLDGHPVPGVEISASSDSLPVVSLADGTFRLSGVAPGVTQVQLDHPDYDSLRKTLRIGLGENRFNAWLSRIPRYPVRGRVLDPDGHPLAGIAVQVRAMTAATTGADGSFDVLLEDGTHELQSQTESYAAAQQIVEVAGGPVNGVDLQLTRGASLSGRVLGLTPAELAGASVEATSAPYAMTRKSPVDSLGRYRLEGLASGAWSVHVLADSRGSRFESIVLAPGDTERELDFLLRESFPVSGRVTGPEGEPVARAMVHFSGADDGSIIPAEADGSFSTTLEAGIYRIETEGHAAGYLEAHGPPLEIHGPVDGIEIRLPKGTALRGHVSGLDLDDPRRVDVEARNGSSFSYGRLTPEGEYRLPGLSPGTWKVEARHGLDTARAQVRIAPGADEAVLDLAFTPGELTLSGRIAGAADLPSLSVALEPAGGGRGVSADADERGDFRFARLHPGTYRLTIYGADPGPYSTEIELSSDRSVLFNLVMSPEARERP